MQNIGYVSGPKVCMCTEENAQVCTMRPGRNCKPAIINMDFDVLTDDEYKVFNDLSSIKSNIKGIQDSLDSTSSQIEKSAKHLNDLIKRGVK